MSSGGHYALWCNCLLSPAREYQRGCLSECSLRIYSRNPRRNAACIAPEICFNKTTLRPIAHTQRNNFSAITASLSPTGLRWARFEFNWECLGDVGTGNSAMQPTNSRWTRAYTDSSLACGGDAAPVQKPFSSLPRRVELVLKSK